MTSLDETTTATLNEFDNWDNANLKNQLLRGIYAYGFEQPSKIQQKSILPMTQKHDIIAQAQSGTGKTGAFTIGTLQLVNPDIKETQAMIISPTRELSVQTHDVITQLGSFIKKLKIKLLIGGTSSDTDIASIKESTPHIVIGCPGRIHDMIRRNFINAQTINLIVLDEADEMLSTGFKEQIYNIFQYMNNDVQVGLFSATIPAEVNALTEKFMRNPVKILVKSEALTLEGISQYFISVEDDKHKYNSLKDLYSIISVSQCIIYCNSVKRVQDLYDVMKDDGFPVCCIHSNMDKSERSTSFMQFKNGKYRVMISSNVTARGIDIQQVSTVINFDIPRDVHTYLHRIGRSGRWGRKGIGVNFITRKDYKQLKNIEQHYHTEINELPNDFAIQM